MNRALVCTTFCMLTLSLGACLDTGQERMAVPLYVRGTDRPTTVASGGVTVALSRADLAFGPLYLCAGQQAGEACDTARFEWLGTVVVDALSSDVRAAGELAGVSGVVLSLMYDLGIRSQLVREEPFVLDAAEALGGNSLVLEGTADIGGTGYPFIARLPIQQTTDTELGVPVVRSSINDDFERDVLPGETGLVITFDPSVWISDVDFNVYAEDGACAPGVTVVCAGALEQRCDETGALAESRLCPDESVCVAGLGCRERIEIEPDSQAYRTIRNALLVGERPAFFWQE